MTREIETLQQHVIICGFGAFIVVALRKVDDTMISHPKHEMLLEAGDTAIVMGHRGDIPQFAKNYVLKRDVRRRGSPRL